MAEPAPLGCPCAGAFFETAFRYDAPPPGEVRFPFSEGSYRREVRRCRLCRHYVSVHEMDTSALYSGTYVDATYGDLDGVRRNFERIVALPPENSDNAGRVGAILAFAARHLPAPEGRVRTVLDVGSGLCVFLHRMRAAGWDCTALDPDPRAARHAQETVGVRAVVGDFMVANDLGRFDLVTFNKVLEHVADPVAMLGRASRHLNPGGIVYVELPDGEAAATEGPAREEFFIEHHHVFSAASVALLATRAGFAVKALQGLREPSAKFTIRAFLVPSLARS